MIAQNTDLLVANEITIANAEPKVTPFLITSNLSIISPKSLCVY